MFVVHACLLRGASALEPVRLGVWGEDSSAPSPPRRPGRRPRVQVHPFAAAHEDLIAAFAETGRKATTSTVTLTLPTRGGAPIASPELVRDDPSAAGGALTAGEWQAAALEFDADLAFAELGELGGLGEQATEAAVWGSSIGHLSEMRAFASDLVARGRLLPSVVAEGPRAVWRPVLTAADAAWARTLALSSPAALFATDPATEFDVWAEALDWLVDAAARAALGSTRLTLGRAADPTTRSWLGALTGSVRTFKADSTAVTGLAAALAEWQRDAAAGPVRACFRLVEPAAENEDWQVRFGLQAAEEPSLIVDAQTVWRSRGTLPALARYVDAPQETLLAELGKAARLYPDLDDALRAARPAHLPLDTEGAHRFLGAVAPLLSTAGFGVQLPGWWTKPSSRLGLRLTASTPGQPGRVDTGGSGLGFDALAEFRYDLAVGGQPLTADELAALSDLKAPLVRLRGQWIELDARRLAAGLKMVARTDQATLGELLRLGLGVDRVRESLPVEGIVADGWLGELLSGRADQRLAPIEAPPSFTGTLRPYQSRGLAWLDFLQRAGLGGVLADDMGLGKTVQLLALLAYDAGGWAEPAGVPDVAGRQLATRGRAVHSAASGARPSR